MLDAIGKLLSWPLLGLVWIYRRLISPLLGVNCRFEPSCSAYAEQALREHGGLRGGWLAIRRVCRCHPWGGSGFDPVPPRESRSENRDTH